MLICQYLRKWRSILLKSYLYHCYFTIYQFKKVNVGLARVFSKVLICIFGYCKICMFLSKEFFINADNIF